LPLSLSQPHPILAPFLAIRIPWIRFVFFLQQTQVTPIFFSRNPPRVPWACKVCPFPCARSGFDNFFFFRAFFCRLVLSSSRYNRRPNCHAPPFGFWRVAVPFFSPPYTPPPLFSLHLPPAGLSLLFFNLDTRGLFVPLPQSDLFLPFPGYFREGPPLPLNKLCLAPCQVACFP